MKQYLKESFNLNMYLTWFDFLSIKSGIFTVKFHTNPWKKYVIHNLLISQGKQFIFCIFLTILISKISFLFRVLDFFNIKWRLYYIFIDHSSTYFLTQHAHDKSGRHGCISILWCRVRYPKTKLKRKKDNKKKGEEGRQKKGIIEQHH